MNTPIVYQNVTPDKTQAERDTSVAEKDLNINMETTEVVEAKGLFR